MRSLTIATGPIGMVAVAELAEIDGANALLRRVVPGQGTGPGTGPGIDDKVASVAASGAVRYFHTDRLGSVVALSAANDNSAANGTAAGTYAYSPWGESDAPVRAKTTSPTSSIAGIAIVVSPRRGDRFQGA